MLYVHLVGLVEGKLTLYRLSAESFI